MTPAREPTEASSPFDWAACWHPVVFLVDLPEDRSLAFTLHDEPLVLFRDGEGRIACLEDVCPHRFARLSRGKVVDGALECGYHGWQFDAGGQCVRIPQWPSDQPRPPRACVKPRAVIERQGIVWVWTGAPDAARPEDLPLIDALDRDDVYHVDFMTDLPYDQGYLVENIIDIAHIHIAHDGVRGGGHRHLALPMAFDVLEDTDRLLRAEFHTDAPGHDRAASPLASAEVSFRAPGLVHYVSNYRNPERIAGLALYALPLGEGRCRLLYRKYSNFYSRWETWKPRWLEHWTQNTILRQDMTVITGQYAAIERSGRELRELWLPLKTCDPLVLRFRQWLDRHPPPGGPFRGFARHAAASHVEDALPPDTYTLHTQQCSTCMKALRTAQRVRLALIGLMAVMLPAMAMASTTSMRIALWAAYFGGVGATMGCLAFERRFR